MTDDLDWLWISTIEWTADSSDGIEINGWTFFFCLLSLIDWSIARSTTIIRLINKQKRTFIHLSTSHFTRVSIPTTAIGGPFYMSMITIDHGST